MFFNKHESTKARKRETHDKMKKYCVILIIVLCHFGLIAQKNCVDFESFEASQNWIKELNELDAESRKDSILNRIKCERFFREKNVEHYFLLFVLNGIIMENIPEYRDYLLSQIKAEDFLWLDNIRFSLGCRIPPKRLGFLVIAVWNKPIINNIDGLRILKVEGKRNRIRLRNSKSQEFTLRIEHFSNRNNYTTEKLHIKRGRRTINLDSRGVNIITITDSENNETVIII